jgi:hypothetical protein
VSSVIVQRINEIAQNLSRYHHILKSKWLEGKQNRRADHLVHTLVTVMLPSYMIHHVRQELGFEGLNLAEKHRKELLVRTLEINTVNIHDLGGDQFAVQSVTNSSCIYSVNLSTQSCDCADWPRVLLCKHVTAAAHFFGNGDLQIESKVSKPTPPIREGSAGVPATEATATSILENVIAVSKALLSHSELPSPETVQSLQMVESHLTAIVHYSTSSESPLPDKEAIPPNQGTWIDTAEQMGAKQRQKKPCPAATSLPEPSATQHIRELNRKKACVKITDPYSSRVSSGRDAAPDAQTTAQNLEVRAAAANGMVLPQPRKRGRKRVGASALSAHPPSSAPPSSAPPSLPTPAWYPNPAAYHPGMYTHTPYLYWPYSQPHLPPS